MPEGPVWETLCYVQGLEEVKNLLWTIGHDILSDRTFFLSWWSYLASKMYLSTLFSAAGCRELSCQFFD
jgi:hypothetical protein